MAACLARIAAMPSGKRAIRAVRSLRSSWAIEISPAWTATRAITIRWWIQSPRSDRVAAAHRQPLLERGHRVAQLARRRLGLTERREGQDAWGRACSCLAVDRLHRALGQLTAAVEPAELTLGQRLDRKRRAPG